MSVSSRLRKYCEENRITQEGLRSKGFGSIQTINNYINGNTEPKASFLEKFIQDFKISADWLMTGRGTPIYKIEKDEDEPCKGCEEKERIIAAQRKTIEIQEKYILSLEEGKKGDKLQNCG